MFRNLHIPILSFMLVLGCTAPQEDKQLADIEFVTNKGTITIKLYDETPQHRDNFLKLVADGFYDSVLFHRVIENFMIQAGDPDSRTASPEDTLGRSDLPYTIPAEFHPDLFHKRGALGAARDNNPARASSSTQFYIVQGRVYNDSLLLAQQGRINNWLAMNRVVNDSANQELVNRRQQLFDTNGNRDSIQAISDRLNELAELDLEFSEKYVYPDEHRTVYQSVGGAAHLDQNYTVFGEVVEGMDIVDKIAASATNDLNRPIEDVRIISGKVISKQND